MDINEYALLLMAKERIEEARREADRTRALRAARPPRRPARVHVGMALVRFGHWILGRPLPAAGSPLGLREARR